MEMCGDELLGCVVLALDDVGVLAIPCVSIVLNIDFCMTICTVLVQINYSGVRNAAFEHTTTCPNSAWQQVLAVIRQFLPSMRSSRSYGTLKVFWNL